MRSVSIKTGKGQNDDVIVSLLEIQASLRCYNSRTEVENIRVTNTRYRLLTSRLIKKISSGTNKYSTMYANTTWNCLAQET